MYKHTETTNTSFITYAANLEHFGIKNHSFCLNLKNEDLKDVDPYDPNLTQEQKQAILEECKVNPWYFFREIVRINTATSPEPVKLEMNDMFAAAAYSILNGRDHYMFSPRQRGRSLIADVLGTYIGGFLGHRTVDIQANPKLRDHKFNRIEHLISLQPDYLYNKEGYSWAVHVEMKLGAGESWESSDLDIVMSHCHFTNYNDGGFSTAYIANGKEDVIFKGYLNKGVDFVVLEDVQYQRAIHETLNFIVALDKDCVERCGVKRFGNLYTVPMENESRTKSMWHQILSMTSGAGYWDRSFVEDRIHFNATWRMEPMTDKDILNMARFMY